MALSAGGEFGYRPLLEAIYAAILDMVGEGFLRADELPRIVIPTVARSREDLAAPFDEGGRFAGLKIEHLEIFEGEDRIWERFESDGDARAFGARWARFCRASVFPTMAGAVDGGSDTPRAAEFVDRLEAAVAGRLAKAPSRMLIPLAKLLLAKAS
jgi:hypothetical protein